jgi:uncharacterized protein (DUF1684 family)
VPSFVAGADAETPAVTHAATLAITIPATVNDEDLVVMVLAGDNPNPVAEVTSVTATGATFSKQGAITNTSGSDSVRAECWIARDVPTGITTVTVTWGAVTVASVHVGRYATVQAIGQVVTASGAAGTAATIAIITQDANNRVVAGLGDEALAQTPFSAASVGTARSFGYALGDGSPDVNGSLVDNTSATPASVACTIGTPATAQTWAAIAVELRSVGTSIPLRRAGAYV